MASPLRLMVREPATDIPPDPDKLVPLSTSPPVAPLDVMEPVIVIAPAAESVSVVLADQLTALETVILPASAPLEPVDTVTLAVAKAVCKEVTLTMEPVPDAVKPEELVAVPVEMVRLKGSSRSVPALPFWDKRSVTPL